MEFIPLTKNNQLQNILLKACQSIAQQSNNKLPSSRKDEIIYNEGLGLEGSKCKDLVPFSIEIFSDQIGHNVIFS